MGHGAFRAHASKALAHFSFLCSKMSDVPGQVKKGLQELKDEITCPVCQDFFQDPKILPCFHYYCKRCVLQLAAREQPFPCPECRGDTLLPPTGADGFPTAFFVNRMKSLHDAMEKVQGATSSGDLVCEQCKSADKAMAFCRHCAQFICNFCREGHRRIKAFSGHTVVSIEELRRNAEENLPIVQPEPMRCKEHQEQLKIYCFTCNQLICRDCTVIDHKDHHFQFVSKCAPEIKQGLHEMLGPLQNAQADIQDAREKLRQEGNEITAQGTHLEKVINGSFDEIIEVVERCRHERLATVRGTVKEKLSSLSSQEKGLEVCTAQIQSLVDFVGQNIGNSSDEEIVSIHKQLQVKIKEEMKSWNSLNLNLIPVTSADIAVDISCAEEIIELCQKKTSVLCKFSAYPRPFKPLLVASAHGFYRPCHPVPFTMSGAMCSSSDISVDPFPHAQLLSKCESEAEPIVLLPGCPVWRHTRHIPILGAYSSPQEHVEAHITTSATAATISQQEILRDRECPVCNTKFPAHVRQMEFESHVHRHFK